MSNLSKSTRDAVGIVGFVVYSLALVASAVATERWMRILAIVVAFAGLLALGQSWRDMRGRE